MSILFLQFNFFSRFKSKGEEVSTTDKGQGVKWKKLLLR